MQPVLGIIGGSGLYDLPGMSQVELVSLDTPFGSPSDALIVGQLEGKKVVFLPRHGKGDRFLPSEVNYRANVFALKKLGVTHLLSVSAVGSLQEKYAPGTLVIPQQILDRTKGQRAHTFFGQGVVGHVSFGDPYCPHLQSVVEKACAAAQTTYFKEGTLVCVEGPRFSSRAESHAFRAQGGAIIGMTAMPEAALAREAELPYCTLALVTDYDCWREHEEAVTVEAVMAVMHKNIESSKKVVRNVVTSLTDSLENPIFKAAQFALMTSLELIPAETKRALAPLYGKYWKT